MNCLIGHPMMTKKEQNTPITTDKSTIPCSRHGLKKIGHRTQFPQKPKCGAGRSYVGVQHNFLARLSVHGG